MPLPTVPVTCTAIDQGGSPVSGAIFRARLDRTETYQGLVAPEIVEAVADASGVAVLHLFPNALGVAGSLYRIVGYNPESQRVFLDTTMLVPNSAANLHQIITSAPVPPLSAAHQAMLDAQAALAGATAQAATATAQAGLAGDHGLSAEAARDSAVEQAGIATNKAAEAATLVEGMQILAAQMATSIIDTQTIVVEHHGFS